MKLLFTKLHALTTRHSTYILLTIIIVFAGGSMVMTVFESASTKQVALSTKKTAMDTHNLVEGENKILAAIKQAELDNSLTATQKTNIIICMLQVPQDQRIPKESDCRKQAVNSDTSDKTSQGISSAGSKTSSVASSNNAPSSASKQPNNSQTGNAGSGQQNTQPTQQPFQILGVKSCVPLLGVCVTH